MKRKNKLGTTSKKATLSHKERGIFIASTVIMIGSLPFTYVFFLLPLLALPIALLAILVTVGIIRNPTIIRTIQFLSVTGALLALWLLGILFNYLSK